MNAANCLKYRALGQRYNLSDICEATDRVITENFADILQHESFNELDISAMRAVLDARPNAVRFIFIRIGQLFCLICKKLKHLVIDFANAKFCVVVFSVFTTFWHYHGFAEVAWWRTRKLTALLIRLHFLKFDAW